MGPRSSRYVSWIATSSLALVAGAGQAIPAWASPGAAPLPEEPLAGFPYGALGLAASVAVLLVIVGITVVVAVTRRQRRR